MLTYATHRFLAYHAPALSSLYGAVVRVIHAAIISAQSSLGDSSGIDWSIARSAWSTVTSTPSSARICHALTA
jgi:hypothetical protein